MHRTAFAGLTALDVNDAITVDGGSFLHQNDVVDRFLQIGCVTHRHDEHNAIPNPVAQLSAAVSTTGGQLEAGITVYAGYTFTDANGGETMISPIVAISTQPQIIPDLPPPTASADYSAGSLPVGGYSYAFAYRDGAGGQTELQPPVFATRVAGHASGQIIVSGLSAGLVSGLVSWEAWRADEGGEYKLLTEGSTDSFTDTGFTCTDCTATPPSVNTTNRTSELTIRLPDSEDDPTVGLATGINLYLSTTGTFGEPSLFAAYPIASAGALITITSLVLGVGFPPPVNRSVAGAHKIEPDTEIDGPWKKAVANEAALPLAGNTDGDVRETLNDHIIHVWEAEAKVWEVIEGTGGGGGGSGHTIEDPIGTNMPPETKLQFAGAVDVTDDPEHQRTVVTVGSGQIINYRGPWVASASYEPGDAATRNGGSYLALTINTGVDPSTDEGVHWGLLAAPGAEGAASGVAIRWRGPWSNATTYSLDDAVPSEGGSYISLISGNIGHPPASDGGVHWGIIALPGHGFTWRGPWAGVATYSAQDIVSREGSTYVSRINENTGVDPLEDIGHTHWQLFVERGKDGPIGPRGEIGASGVPGLRYRGDWSGASAYIPHDVVQRGGSSVVCISPSPSIGIDPQTDGFIHWGLLASKGERGASGLRGLEGPRGASGASGMQGPAGELGPAGERGETGVSISTGLRFRGAYEAGTTYGVDDVVSEGGKFYVSVFASNKGHDPATDSGEHWVEFLGEGPIETHAWAIDEVETGERPGFTVKIGTAEAGQRIVGLSTRLESGEEAIVQVRVNGTPIPALEEVKVTNVDKEIPLKAKTKEEEEEGVPPPFNLKDGDYVDFNIVSVAGTPVGLSASLYVEHIVGGGITGFGVGPLSTMSEIPLNTPQTPSTSEATFVFITFDWDVEATTWEAEIMVGGVKVGNAYLRDDSPHRPEGWPLSFPVGNNESYEIKTTGTTTGVKVFASYAAITGGETGATGAKGEVGPPGEPGPSGSAGSAGPPGALFVSDDDGGAVASAVAIEFMGSGATDVDVSNMGGGSALVKVTTVPGISLEGGAGPVLPHMVLLDFVASGAASVGVADLGGGSGRITFSSTGGGGGGGSGAGALTISNYTAEAEVGLNEPHEISSTEGAIVMLTLEWNNGETEWDAEVLVGGVKIGKGYLKDVRSGAEEWTMSFLLPAGQSYEIKTSGSITSVKLFEGYATILSGEAGEAGAPGAPGAPGLGILHGVGAPSNSLGSNGEFYIDDVAWEIYGPKAAGVWPAGVALATGPMGKEGPPGSGSLTVGGSAVISPRYFGITALGFAASGNASLAVQDLGGGSAQVLISDEGGGGAPAALFDEPFTTNKLSSFTFDEGTSEEGLTVTGGVLHTTGAKDHEFHPPEVSVEDFKQVVKIHAQGKTPLVLLGKFINDENQIKIQYFSGKLDIYLALAGSFVQHGSVGVGLTAGRNYWLVMRLTNNVFFGELWDSDPRFEIAGSLIASLKYELEEAAIAVLGSSIKGFPFIALTGYEGAFTTTETTLDDWIVVPLEASDRTNF